MTEFRDRICQELTNARFLLQGRQDDGRGGYTLDDGARDDGVPARRTRRSVQVVDEAFAACP
jgi:hypothetical protein